MKNSTILLVSTYRGFLTTYAALLSSAYHVLARETLPDPDEFIVKRVRLILIINQWKKIPDFSILELAENLKIPVVVLDDIANSNIRDSANQSLYLTAIVLPVTNEQLLIAVHNALQESSSPGMQSSLERSEVDEKAFKSAYKSTAFRRKIDKIIEFFETNYSEVDNLHTIADAFDVNYESMRRAIEHKTGKLPNNYVKSIKIEKMLQLIQFTKLKPEEICLEVGFQDIYHAQKLFQNEFDLTIDECIKQLRLNNSR